MDNQNGQRTNSSELRMLKNLKQQLPVLPKITTATSPPQKHVNQNVPAPPQKHVNQNVPDHASNKDMVGISTTGEPISSSKLPTTTETQGKTDKVIPSVINEKSCKIPNTESIYCFTCDSTATGEEILTHLFFGALKCADCTTAIRTCKKFSNMYHGKDPCTSNGNSPHTFTKWSKEPYVFIHYSIRKDIVIKRYCDDSKCPPAVSEISQATDDYIKTLSVLRSHHPWKQAFHDSQGLLGYKKSLIQCDTLQTKIGIYLSKSVGNSLTHEQKSVRVNSKAENPLARTNNPEEQSKSNKRVKFSHCNKTDYGDTRGQANEIGSIPKNSDMILHVSQSSKSVGNSLIHAQKNINVLENSADENPLSGTNNKKELKRSNNHMIGNQSNKSDFAQHGDDRCLVVHHPREKCPTNCPECHCTLRISRLTFDCSTYITKVVCPNCAFPIYIKLDWKTKLVFQKSLLMQT